MQKYFKLLYYFRKLSKVCAVLTQVPYSLLGNMNTKFTVVLANSYLNELYILLLQLLELFLFLLQPQTFSLHVLVLLLQQLWLSRSAMPSFAHTEPYSPWLLLPPLPTPVVFSLVLAAFVLPLSWLFSPSLGGLSLPIDPELQKKSIVTLFILHLFPSHVF